MAIIKGYTEEGKDILHREAEMDVGLALLKRGLEEDDKEIAISGYNHLKKYLVIDVNSLSVIGLYHWSRVVDKFYKYYYDMIKDDKPAQMMSEINSEYIK